MKYSDIEQYEDIAKYYINISSREICKLIDLHEFELAFYKLDWSKRRRSSRGGWYPNKGGAGISIAMSATTNIKKGRVSKVYEYASFQDCPIIGSIYTKNTEDKIALHCLHEVAHAAQYWSKYLKGKSAGKPHGYIWKSLYRHLRVNILNPSLEDQKTLKKEYEEVISSIKKVRTISYNLTGQIAASK